jgi:hypothetical protein
MATMTAAPSLFEPVGGEPTLEDEILGVWEGLITHRLAACPVCGEEMAPVYGAQALPIGGRCGGCDTTLG